LFSCEEAAESFKDCSFNDLLRPLPDFILIPIAIHSGRPQNLLNDKYWHPLRLFKLFFNWEIMSIIVKETNSYAFRTNSAKNPWKTLEIQELYHFFGWLIRLGLFKHPPRVYSWHSGGVLLQVLLSKNRFESILSNFHFKDRGFNPIQGNWWDKLEPVFSILRQKCSFYWIPSTNLTINEIMLKFEGRTTQKITIPGKPIPTGFKIFALGDSGYIYNWECTRPGLAEGVLKEKKRISVSILNSKISTFLNPTQSVVIRLIKCLSIYIQKGLSFHLFLDNLFVCWKSAIALKERGIAVIRIVRKGTSGYPPRLLQLKKVNRGLLWGALQASIIRGVYY
jgi:Transposase IS4